MLGGGERVLDAFLLGVEFHLREGEYDGEKHGVAHSSSSLKSLLAATSATHAANAQLLAAASCVAADEFGAGTRGAQEEP